MLIDVYLGVNKDLKLTYELYDNQVTRLFYNRLSTQNNQVISRKEFYNFGETPEEVTQQIQQIVDKIHDLDPSLLDSDSTNNLNKLHINFPKNHDKYKDNPDTYWKTVCERALSLYGIPSAYHEKVYDGVYSRL